MCAVLKVLVLLRMRRLGPEGSCALLIKAFGWFKKTVFPADGCLGGGTVLFVCAAQMLSVQMCVCVYLYMRRIDDVVETWLTCGS